MTPLSSYSSECVLGRLQGHTFRALSQTSKRISHYRYTFPRTTTEFDRTDRAVLGVWAALGRTRMFAADTAAIRLVNMRAQKRFSVANRTMSVHVNLANGVLYTYPEKLYRIAESEAYGKLVDELDATNLSNLDTGFLRDIVAFRLNQSTASPL